MEFEILYWRGSAEKRWDLIKALGALGNQVREIRTFEENLDVCRRSVPSLLIVDGTAGAREASDRIIELSTTSVLYKVPTAFVSPQAQKRAAVLERQFEKIIAIDVPYSLEVVLQQLAEFMGAKLDFAAIDSGSAGARPAKVETEDVGETAKVGGWFPVATEFSIEQIGQFFSGNPLQETVLEAALIMQAADSWLVQHAYRVAKLCRTVCQASGMDDIRRQRLEAVGFMLNFGFAENSTANPENRTLVRRNLLSARDLDSIPEFCEMLSRSADFLSRTAQGERACVVLAIFASLLEGQQFEPNEDVVVDAQCLLLAELADRACWNTGTWNPLGAYKVMRELRSEKTFLVSAEISKQFARILGEAVRAGISANQRRVTKQAAVDDNSQQVSIYSLSPGMRVAMPIAAVDGKVVLGDKVRLDRDLIWRLWQLSAVRPLRDEVSIS